MFNFRQAGQLASAVQWNGATQSFVGLASVSDFRPALALSIAHSGGVFPFSNLVAIDKPYVPTIYPIDLSSSTSDVKQIAKDNSLKFTGNWYDNNGVIDKDRMVYNLHFYHTLLGLKPGDQISFSFMATALVPDGLKYEARSFEYHPTVVTPNLDVDAFYSIDTLTSKVVVFKLLGSFYIPRDIPASLPMHCVMSIRYFDLENVFGSGRT